MEAGGNSSPRRRGKHSDSGSDEAVVKAAAEALGREQEKDPLTGLPANGIKRPWMRYGAQLRTRNLVEDVGVVLWEGGAKTTPDLKREIVEFLDQADSLVVVLDLKRAERPEDPNWWPSLRVVLAWVEEDPFFAKAIDQWRHARQEFVLERITHDLFSEIPRSKEELGILKERVKFAASVLPRTVNKGMRDKVDIEQTQNHLHLHAALSEEALDDRLAQMSRDPRVREFINGSGLKTLPVPGVLEGQVVAPPSVRPELPDLPFRDAEALQRDLGGETAP